MQLISIEIDDPKAGWSLSKVEFFTDVTLLVGLSGVGKTRILDSIRRLGSISKGKTSVRHFGVRWKLEFKHKNQLFVWAGEFEKPSSEEEDVAASLIHPFIDEDDIKAPQPDLTSESLKIDNIVVARRTGDKIFLDEKETPKLSNKESLLHILKNEESIAKAYEGMDSILHVDHSVSQRRSMLSFGSNFENMKKKFQTIDDIRSEDMPTQLKLALAHEICPEVFEEISRQFQEAFPYVQEIGIRLIEVGPFGKIPRLFMKEVGVEQCIAEEAISSGMHRTLMHLSRMSLWPNGTVVLVDEFENSFGVNCIHYVTQDLQVHSQRMQFILTSHHPYIINNIDMKNWKIVSRSGQTVGVQGSSSLKNKASHHDAFLQLMNLPQFSEGISIE